jgi:hypothetical protein
MTSDMQLKAKKREAVNTLSRYWRNTLRLSISLERHTMEKHVCNFNDTYGIKDEEESFVE